LLCSWTRPCPCAGGTLPFFICQSIRPVPVGKSVGGCGVIDLRDNHSVLGVAVARYSRGDSSVTRALVPERRTVNCLSAAGLVRSHAAHRQRRHLTSMRQVVTAITSCRAASYRKAVAPASASRPRLITPCERVRLVLDSDGKGLPTAELTPYP